MTGGPRVLIYPADEFGCGSFRLIWPGEYAAEAGYPVTVQPPEHRQVRMAIGDGNNCTDVMVPDDVDVIVFQRTTHLWVAQAVSILAAKGYAVVVDVDDDLEVIHRDNPAYDMLNPLHMQRGARDSQGRPFLHSWKNLAKACEDATLVTVSAPGLVRRYGKHGRIKVIPNYLPDHYYGIERTDSDSIGWPASLHSHPTDPGAVGSAVSRVLRERRLEFKGFGDTKGVARAYGFSGDDPEPVNVPLLDWPKAIAECGIGIAPLADTHFNSCKSWLKPLELSAAGVPWVASPRTEYKRLHYRGAGLLAEKSSDWYQHLTQLAKSPELRADLSGRGREVAEGLRLRDHAWEFAEAWQEAYDRKPALV